MLYIENIDAYSIRFRSVTTAGTFSQVLPKSLEARKDTSDRVWISHTERKENIINNELPANVSLNGIVYGTAEEFVTAFNDNISSSTPYTTTTTTAAPTTTTTTTT